METLRAGYGTAPGCDQAWRGLAALDALGLLVDPAHGGVGGNMIDVAVVAEECGRAIYRGPYEVSAVGATWLLTQARPASSALERLVRGEAIATLVAHDGRAAATPPTARVDGDRTTINGTAPGVIAGTVADIFLMMASDRSPTPQVYLVERGAGVECFEDETIDGSRPTALVSFTDAPGELLAFRGTHAPPIELFEGALDRARTALALDAVGAAQLALELTVTYARDRIAFDRPIGSFQAVQHLCADMLRALELARAAAYFAAWALDHAERPTARAAVMQAAAFCCDELPRLGASAIQVFAGVGFTWEHDIQLVYKRLVSSSAALGTANDHLAALADLVF